MSGWKNPVDLVVIGNVVMDVLTHPVSSFPEPDKSCPVDSVALMPGGCGYHTALTAATLGVPTGLIGRIGDDTAGRAIRDRLERAGPLDGRGVRAVEHQPTDVTLVLIDDQGGRRFIVGKGGASTGMSLDDADTARALEARHLHLAGFGLSPAATGEVVAALLRTARDRGLGTSLDLAWVDGADHRRWLDPCLPHLMLVTPNLEEARAATGCREAAGCADWLLERGVGAALLTMGEKGLFVATGSDRYHIEAPRVTVVDTTGAGDSFAGGLLAAQLDPALMPESLVPGGVFPDLVRQAAFGAACGALACTGIGGEAGPRSLAEVHELLAVQPPRITRC